MVIWNTNDKPDNLVHMHCHLFTILAVCLGTSIPVSARLRVSAGFEDIQGMTQHAPLIFRGQVAEIQLADKSEKGSRVKDGLAVIAVDRWCRGSSSKWFVNVHLVYAPPQGDNGHYCRDLEVGSYQIVFARPGEGKTLELFDDCEGALSVCVARGQRHQTACSYSWRRISQPD